MKISLVIPAHNEEKYIESAIKNSDGKFHEIIVVDNASTDKTKQIAETFSGVRVVSEPSKGLTKARQKGLMEAKGDLVAYVDADTLMPKKWTEKVLKEFQKNTKIVCVSGPYKYYDVSFHKKIFIWLFWNLLAHPSYFFTGYMVTGGNFVAKKEALHKINGFDTTIEFYGEDTDIAKRLHKIGKIYFANKLYMPTSGRRFKGEGFTKTAIKYIINFSAIALKGKPTTKNHIDIR